MTVFLDEIKIEPRSKEIEREITHKWDLLDKPQKSLGNI